MCNSNRLSAWNPDWNAAILQVHPFLLALQGRLTMRSLPIQLCVPVLAGALVVSSRVSYAADTSRLQFQVRDERSQPLPCQIYVKNDKGEPQRAAGLPFWNWLAPKPISKAWPAFTEIRRRSATTARMSARRF